MPYQITHVRVSESFPTSTEKITDVKLSSGSVETVAQVVKYLDLNMEYFYTTSASSRALVESVHPVGRPAYIRTKANATTKDNLLSLPRF
ncbi:DUF3892 domain-containing protein [Enterococcus larvae]|uniref:DUF3892 domain-containing protein n=1 Tax=Enterococcus larvae TaxID=2794352 RepID=UPI003F3C5F39